MAAMLVALGVMAVLMSAAMPVWRQAAQREKEEELVFRGKQYARAIGLFQRKYANAYPPTLDVLVEQHFVRKKYKDPITNDDFQPLYQVMQVQPGMPGGGRGATRPGQTVTAAPAGTTAGSGLTAAPSGPRGGIIGVTSKSKDKSIRIYNGRDHYNEWQFVWVPATVQPGMGRPGQVRPGMPMGPGGQPLGPGGQPMRPGTRPGGPGGFGPGGMGPGQMPFGPGGRPPYGQPPVQPAQPRGPGGQ